MEGSLKIPFTLVFFAALSLLLSSVLGAPAAISIQDHELLNHHDGLVTQLLFKIPCGRAIRILSGLPFLTKVFNHKFCQSWYSKDQGLLNDTLPCPPTMEQAREDKRFEAWWDIPPQITGIAYYMQIQPSASGSAQMCGYTTSNGRMLMGPKMGGHPFKYSPNFEGHCEQNIADDVMPYLACCLFGTNEDCPKYYEKRPSNDGEGYEAPQ